MCSDIAGRHTQKCPYCKGTGYRIYIGTKDKRPCAVCKGKGFVVEDLDEVKGD